VDISDTGTGTHFIGVIPPAAILAMLQLITTWYDQRTAPTEDKQDIPAVGNLLAPICWGGTYV
jgi:hypothetical protein